MILESQIPHKTVKLLSTITNQNNKLTILWGSWLKPFDWYVVWDKLLARCALWRGIRAQWSQSLSLRTGRASSAALSTRPRRSGTLRPEPRCGRFYPTQCIYQMVLESQLPHEIVNLFINISLLYNLNILWWSWLSKNHLINTFCQMSLCRVAEW